MGIKKIIYGVLILVLSTSYFSLKAQQNSDSVIVDNRHQIGINASKFLALLNDQENSLELIYRYSFNNPYSLRAALSYEQNTADDGIWDVALKLGVDRKFKKSDKWIFYYGVDMFFQNSIINSSDRTTTKVGGFVFIGIMRKFGNHFSLATEPNFSVVYVDYKDPSAFSTDANRSWYEYEFGNIGQIQVNFHF